MYRIRHEHTKQHGDGYVVYLGSEPSVWCRTLGEALEVAGSLALADRQQEECK
jgi:hypothetical protein